MFSAVISIFLLMFIGFIARRAGVLRASDADVVRSIVTNITGPAFVFASIHGKPINTDMMIAPIVHFGSLLVVLVAAFLIARAMKLDKPTTGGLMLAAAFGNTGFLGYPLTSAAFPSDNTAMAAAVMIDQLGMTVPLYSLGIAIAVGFGSDKDGGFSALGFLKTPLFISMVLVFILRTVYIPPLIMTTIQYFANATIPLAMLSLGLSIRRVPIKSLMLPFAAACLLKFVALPLVNLTGLDLVGMGGTVRSVAILQTTMPTAIMASVLAGRYGSNGTFVSAAVFLMTLMSVITIPLALAIVH